MTIYDNNKKVNFFISQLIGLAIGLIFRYYLKPCKENTFKRHIYAILCGILLGYFCFGSQILHLISHSFICWLVLLLCPRNHVHLYIIIYINIFFLILRGIFSKIQVLWKIVGYEYENFRHFFGFPILKFLDHKNPMVKFLFFFSFLVAWLRWF